MKTEQPVYPSLNIDKEAKLVGPTPTLYFTIRARLFGWEVFHDEEELRCARRFRLKIMKSPDMFDEWNKWMGKNPDTDMAKFMQTANWKESKTP